MKHFEKQTAIWHPYRCKYCKVPVIGRYDFRAVLGKTHAKHCPRSK